MTDESKFKHFHMNPDQEPIPDFWERENQEHGEPVAYLCENAVGHKYFRWKKPSSVYKPIPLYTTPQQRKPLTHEQRFDLLTQFEPHKNKWEAPAILIDMVEAAHGIKEKNE